MKDKPKNKNLKNKLKFASFIVIKKINKKALKYFYKKYQSGLTWLGGYTLNLSSKCDKLNFENLYP